MRISKKTYYGLRAIALLAEYGGELSVREISKSEEMPEDFLHKILQNLKKAGLVTAEKGVDGGYTLARKSRCITVWDIVSTLDGDLRSFEPPKLTQASPYPKLTHCQTNLAWRKLNETIKKTFSKISIADLITPSLKK